MWEAIAFLSRSVLNNQVTIILAINYFLENCDKNGFLHDATAMI